LALEAVGFELDMFSEPLAERLLCSICCNVFNNAHSAPCGHTFCLHCIGRWLDDDHNICPMDRQSLHRNQLNPCLALTDVIEELQLKCSE